MTEQQWQALCKLRLLSPGRQQGASTMALRAVLMEGKSSSDAAREYGLTRQAVCNALGKTRECIENARIVATIQEGV